MDAFILSKLEAERAAALAGSRPGDFTPPRQSRSHRTASDPGGSRRIRKGPVAQRLGKGRGSPAGLAALRRALGPALAGRGALRRESGLQSATRRGRTPGDIATTSSGRFNTDKPYDRFVREQIAGDEIWPDDPKRASRPASTGTTRTSTMRDNLMQRRQEILNDVTNVVGQRFPRADGRAARSATTTSSIRSATRTITVCRPSSRIPRLTTGS